MRFLPPISSHGSWRARYEQLRAGWIVGEVTWGQALIIQQGMAAWMKSWPAEERSEPFRHIEVAKPNSSSVAPSMLQQQLTRELTNLIVNRQQEVVA